MNDKWKKSGLALLILGFVNLGYGAGIYAAETSEDEEEENKVTITGSRLKRTDIETAQPVLVITAEEIEARGFTTAFEALQSLTQVNGSNQGAQDGGTFTQGADSLNMRAIGPGRTLTLINGRRMADYPMPFNGQSNIVNVANIPAMIIDRIEVLSAGASAIYGSDAVAGVVNFILKDNVEGIHASLRVGDTHDGGGESYRFQLSGGTMTSKLNLVYGLELFNREPIMAYEREFMDSYHDNPDVINGYYGVVNTRSFLALDPFDGNDDGFTYIDPGEAACDPLSHLANGTMEYSNRPGRGNYCGTAYDIGFNSIRNAKDNITGYVNMNYELNSAHDLFATMVIADTKTEYDVGTTWWQPYTMEEINPAWNGYVMNINAELLAEHGPTWYEPYGIDGVLQLWQRVMTPEEVADNNNHFNETAIDVTVGAKGELFGNFEYEATLSMSKYDTTRERRLIDKATADLFFLGPVVDTVDFGNGIWTVHDAPMSRLYTPLTNDEYLTISGIDTTKADSSNTTATFVATNSELFELPGGDAGLAIVLEYASQDYDITLDPKMINQEWAAFTGTGGGGERDRTAIGAEMMLPLGEELTLTLASRYDNYNDDTNVDGALTYNVGVEFRPVEPLLLRGSISTSFRAPDMHYVYADPSGFYQGITDRYLCRLQGQVITTPGGTADYNSCNINIGNTGSPAGVPGQYTIFGERSGSTFLEEEEGESFTVGFVYDITDDMSFTLDYYSIELNGVVTDRSTSSLLELEANCRLGSNFSGSETFDIDSAECQNAISIVERYPNSDTPISEQIMQITTGPMNASYRKQTGIDASYDYRLTTDTLGDFRFNLYYNLTIDDESRQFPDDDIVDQRHHMWYFTNRSQVNLVTQWSYGDWITTLTAMRAGSMPNWIETERCCIRTTANLAVNYEITEDLGITLIVKNLRNKSPQEDDTFYTYPYYFTGQVDAYGREYSLQVDYSFGD